MKFVLLVEGQTEKDSIADFIRRWLDPQLQQRVGIQTVNFKGFNNLLRDVVRKARDHLDGPRNEDIIAAIGLIDLYGPQKVNFYPEHAQTADERWDWGVQHLEREVARDRFKMFFAVHEFEAWLFSQPSIFPPAISKALPDKIAKPETVNFDEPPAKLLDRVYKAQTKRSYKKTTYGKDLFKKLNPVDAVAKCPRLKQMLEEMLRLAQLAAQ